MNMISKAMLFSLAIGFGATVTASPNGGLVDRINEARTYPSKTVETETRVEQEHQKMMEWMQKMHSQDGEMTQGHCIEMLKEHVSRG
jgi:hypothetical protein